MSEGESLDTQVRRSTITDVARLAEWAGGDLVDHPRRRLFDGPFIGGRRLFAGRGIRAVERILVFPGEPQFRSVHHFETVGRRFFVRQDMRRTSALRAMQDDMQVL